MPFNFRDRKPLRAYGQDWVAIPFSFIPNTSDSTGNPATATIVGPVNVSWTATGVYHVAIKGGGFPQMTVPSVQQETALKGLFQLDVTNVNAAAGTFQIRAYTQATTTLINFTATTSAQRVHGTILAQASSYTR